MANLPYWTEGDGETEEIAARIRLRRGGALLNLDRILLHSPPIANGWNALIGAVRTQTTLSDFHRELAICAVAAMTGADYEFHHHGPLLIAAGASDAQMRALADVAAAAAASDLFDERARAVLLLALESTRSVSIPATALQAVRAAFPEPRALVELIITIGAYNMVSRVLVAAGVDIERD